MESRALTVLLTVTALKTSIVRDL